MKRVKRDKSHRAFQRGYQVGLSGRSRELCPFEEFKSRQHWLEGWQNGRADHWSGFSGIAGLHKVNQLSYQQPC